MKRWSLKPADTPEGIEEAKDQIYGRFQAEQDNLQLICGTPDTVIPKIRHILETVRPGIFSLWHHHGPVSHEDRMTSIRLLGDEVLPAMRSIADELGLPAPTNAPRFPPLGGAGIGLTTFLGSVRF